MINIALPKGRMGQQAYELLESAGYACEKFEDIGRKLVLEDEANGIRYFLVKPSDTPVYIEHGVADIGIAGRDVLLERSPDVHELKDLQFGKCYLAVAAKADWSDNRAFPLRVATTYPNCARRYFTNISRAIEIIKLNGSVELAPLLGLSDVIVDIVETGTTLRENGLVVKTRIADSSARLIANKSSYLFKREEIDTLIERMEQSL